MTEPKIKTKNYHPTTKEWSKRPDDQNIPNYEEQLYIVY